MTHVTGCFPFLWTSYFNEGYADGPLSDVRFHLVTEFTDELVWDYEDEVLCSFDCFGDVWDCNLERQNSALKHNIEEMHHL